MLDDVAGYLACPHCARPLEVRGRTLTCAGGHTTDVARHGHVTLVAGRGTKLTGDTAAMVAARQSFLAAGHFGAVSAALEQAATRHDAGGPGCVLDLGSGPGYYLAGVLDALPTRVGIALDVSVHAARRAARAHPRVGAVVADAWSRLPVLDQQVALAINVFAPRSPAEVARVLAPGGALVVVSPTSGHLAPLVGELGLMQVPADKLQRQDRALVVHLDLVDRTHVAKRLRLSADDVVALIGMGPNAFRTSDEQVRAGLSGDVDVDLRVVVSTYRDREARGA